MFSNEQIQLDELPDVASLNLKSLPKQYKYTQLITRGLMVTVFLIFAILFKDRSIDEFDLVKRAWPLLGILTAVWILWPILAHRYRGYALRQHDLVYISGIIWRSTTVIAFNRVQHIENKQGPLDRIFDLSSLELFTAGGSSGDLSIPGLLRNDATRIRQHILSKMPNSAVTEA